jgi:hypothetical protein
LLHLGDEIGNFGHELDARMVLSAVAIYHGDLALARTSLQPVMEREESRDELRVSRLRLMQGWLLAAEGDTGGSLAVLRPLVTAAGGGTHAWCWSPPWMRTSAGIGLAARDNGFADATATLAELGAERNPGVPTMRGSRSTCAASSSMTWVSWDKQSTCCARHRALCCSPRR